MARSRGAGVPAGGPGPAGALWLAMRERRGRQGAAPRRRAALQRRRRPPGAREPPRRARAPGRPAVATGAARRRRRRRHDRTPAGPWRPMRSLCTACAAVRGPRRARRATVTRRLLGQTRPSPPRRGTAFPSHLRAAPARSRRRAPTAPWWGLRGAGWGGLHRVTGRSRRPTVCLSKQGGRKMRMENGEGGARPGRTARRPGTCPAGPGVPPHRGAPAARAPPLSAAPDALMPHSTHPGIDSPVVPRHRWSRAIPRRSARQAARYPRCWGARQLRTLYRRRRPCPRPPRAVAPPRAAARHPLPPHRPGAQ
jgi:hypothetical protein